jgi:hypothetical protein
MTERMEARIERLRTQLSVSNLSSIYYVKSIITFPRDKVKFFKQNLALLDLIYKVINTGP